MIVVEMSGGYTFNCPPPPPSLGERIESAQALHCICKTQHRIPQGKLVGVLPTWLFPQCIFPGAVVTNDKCINPLFHSRLS